MERPIDRLKGTVKWFDDRKGFGFISPENGGQDLFVHHSSIKAVGYRSLAKGEAVEFFSSVDDYGRTQAVGVTGPGGACVQGRRYGGGDAGGRSNGFTGVMRFCYRCGEVGHMARSCYMRNSDCGEIATCYVCGQLGHFSWQCPGKSCSLEIPSSRPMASLSDCSDGSSDEEDEVGMAPVGEHEETEKRNWADLPRDVLTVIFKKITAINVLMSAQFVCKPWRQLSLVPELWRCIDMTDCADLSDMVDMVCIAKEAVDKSQGRLEEFYAMDFVDDELMLYIAERTTNLRCLRLISAEEMSEEVLAQALSRFPLLEELEITHCASSEDIAKLVGQACPQLKCFRLNREEDYTDYLDMDQNADALAIAEHMQQLRQLQLVGNDLTIIGLHAILDNCPYLEYLELQQCFYISKDETLMKKCARIKDLRLPDNSNSTVAGRGLSYDYCDMHHDYDEYEFYDGYDDWRFDYVI